MKKTGGKRLEPRTASTKEKKSKSDDSKEKKPGGIPKTIKTMFTIFIVIIAIGLGTLFAWELFKQPPEVDDHLPDVSASVTSMPNGGDNPANTDVSPSPNSQNNQELAMREGVYTVLLVGTFEDGNTDTIMVGTLDTKNSKLEVISIPRDTLVECKRSVKKINAAYGTGGGNAEGMEYLADEVETILGFRPSFYVMVKMKAFKNVVNAIGGVDFDVPVRMYHFDGKNTINISKGQHHLLGDEALQVMRYRGYGEKSGVGSNDYGRMKVQQMFLTAIANQMLQVKNIPKIPEIVSIVAENVKPTDLTLNNMAWFSEELIKIGFENINFHTLPTSSVNYQGGNGVAKAYYEIINKDEALKLINETVNPWNMEITQDLVKWNTLK